MYHWREHNPWGDAAVYVPVEDLADCVAGGYALLGDGTMALRTPELVLAGWRNRVGARLDGYIIPQPGGDHLVGIRFGPEGSQYLTPVGGDPEKVEALLRRFSNDYASSTPIP